MEEEKVQRDSLFKTKVKEVDVQQCPDLSTGYLTHHSTLLFIRERVFIRVRGACFALKDGHSRVSQRCVGRHRGIIHISTLWAAPMARVAP